MQNPASTSSPLHAGSSDTRRDLWIGMSDGISIPFALLAALSVVLDNTHSIGIAGLVILAIGSITMGLGGFLIAKAEQANYLAELEQAESPEKMQSEIAGRKEFVANLELDEKMQLAVTEDLEKEKKDWIEFVSKYELMANQHNPVALRNSALRIALAYCIGGMIPVSAYFFLAEVQSALQLSILLTLPALFLLGYFKSKADKEKAWIGALQTVLSAALAAAVLYAVAHVF